ncbi:MAG: uncharacterized protein KVP18_003481 [Porospora cf. gigantea A]|uniref:uncharacterized protein n=1 Tax=Porospora cf. gigantea A TaxID=2853593 RepID=UPI00355A2E37|nr:MAG: hypothetical protein KVP18_003481 [Porospora cf. gigantea A]
MGKSKPEELAHFVAGSYLSPIAVPLLDDKLLERSVKLVKKSAALETELRESDSTKRIIRRGIQDVTKSLRKGEKGVVLLAGDVHPVEVLAHLPAYCEEKNVPYAFVGSKETLGSALKTQRTTTAVLVITPAEELETYSLYKKVMKGVLKINSRF